MYQKTKILSILILLLPCAFFSCEKVEVDPTDLKDVQSVMQPIIDDGGGSGDPIYDDGGGGGTGGTTTYSPYKYQYFHKRPSSYQVGWGRSNSPGSYTNTVISGGGTSAGPAAVVFNGKTFVYKRAANDNVYVSYTSNNSSWTEKMLHNAIKTDSDLHAIVFKNQVYLFFNGINSTTNVGFYAVSSDGINFTPYTDNGVGRKWPSVAAPAPAVDNSGRLWVFWAVAEGGYTKIYSEYTYDGYNFTKGPQIGSPLMELSDGMSAVIQSGNLFITYRRNGFSCYGCGTYSAQNQNQVALLTLNSGWEYNPSPTYSNISSIYETSARPSIALSYDGLVRVFFKRDGYTSLICATRSSSGVWGWTVVPGETDDSPYLVSY